MSITRRIAMFTDQDIFITNTTSTYQDIPQDCKLVGAEFDQDYQPDSIHQNITDDGTFGLVQQYDSKGISTLLVI